MIVGFFVITLYLRATATSFYWGRASRWSQWALIACAVTVVLTMVTMGYTRETARRVDNNPGYLIYNCITLEQELTPETCPASGLGGVGRDHLDAQRLAEVEGLLVGEAELLGELVHPDLACQLLRPASRGVSSCRSARLRPGRRDRARAP
jgi:hypothetical protein